MKVRPYLLALSLNLIGAVSAVAEPVNVLGLPLGGRLNISLEKTCSEVGSKSLCLLIPPTTTPDLELSGMLVVPGAEKMPKWADVGWFEARITQEGILQSFKVENEYMNDFPLIMNSIKTRFGPAQRHSSPRALTPSAQWDLPGIHIRLACTSQTGCAVEFISPAAYDKVQRKKAAEHARDAARSTAP